MDKDLQLLLQNKRGRVVDYKTGKVPKGLQDNDFAGGQALQLPIYLLAAEALFARTIIELAQYRYVTRSGDYVARTFTREALAERRAVFMSMLNTIAEGVRKGRFFVGLPDTGNCDFCDFRAVCGPFAAAVSQFKAGDPAVQRFLRMREAE